MCQTAQRGVGDPSGFSEWNLHAEFIRCIVCVASFALSPELARRWICSWLGPASQLRNWPS